MLVEAFAQAREGAETWIQSEQEKVEQDLKVKEEQTRVVCEKRNKRYEEARAVYDEVKKALLAQEECLKQVAVVISVKLRGN
jgi:hypothetical protein